MMRRVLMPIVPRFLKRARPEAKFLLPGCVFMRDIGLAIAPIRQRPTLFDQLGVQTAVSNKAFCDTATVHITVFFCAAYRFASCQFSEKCRSLFAAGIWCVVPQAGLPAFRCIDAVKPNHLTVDAQTVAINHKGFAAVADSSAVSIRPEKRRTMNRSLQAGKHTLRAA